MRHTTNTVPYAWVERKKAHAAALSTDGTFIWSYNLVIGMIHKDKKIVFDYTNRAGHMMSRTTSKHVGKLYHLCDEITLPGSKKWKRLSKYFPQLSPRAMRGY